MKYLIELDYFSKKYSAFYNEKQSFKTLIGAFISIVFYFILLIFIYYSIIDSLNKYNAKFISYYEKNELPDQAYFKLNELPLFVFNKGDYLDLSNKLKIEITDGNKIIPAMIVKCNDMDLSIYDKGLLNIINYKYSSRYLDLDKAFCIYNTEEIYIKNFSPVQYKLEIIDDSLDNINLLYYFYDRLAWIDRSDVKPYEYEINEESITVKRNKNVNNIYIFSLTKLHSDEGYIIIDSKDYNIFTLKERINSGTFPDNMACITFVNDGLVRVYKRKYGCLLDVLKDFAGFMKGLKILKMLIHWIFYKNYSIIELVNNYYSNIENDKSIKNINFNNVEFNGNLHKLSLRKYYFSCNKSISKEYSEVIKNFKKLISIDEITRKINENTKYNEYTSDNYYNVRKDDNINWLKNTLNKENFINDKFNHNNIGIINKDNV